jgi:predicted thioesterase
MKTSQHLQPGLKLEKDFIVEEKHAASHVGSGSVRVLATPWMIAFMEITSRILLDDHLPEGYSSVGTHLDIRHLAPSSLGSTVHVSVEITAVDGNKVSLNVSAKDGEVEVGAGTHERFVIEVERFLQRIEKSK